jgi:hypothetical protein
MKLWLAFGRALLVAAAGIRGSEWVALGLALFTGVSFVIMLPIWFILWGRAIGYGWVLGCAAALFIAGINGWPLPRVASSQRPNPHGGGP